MLSPSDIRPAVREVLLATGNSLASYQILDRLPAPLLDQILAERGLPGAGSGNSYSAASLVTDAVEGLLPNLDAPHRVYLDVSGMNFSVADKEIQPGHNSIAFYRLVSEIAADAADEVSASATSNAMPVGDFPYEPPSPNTRPKASTLEGVWDSIKPSIDIENLRLKADQIYKQSFEHFDAIDPNLPLTTGTTKPHWYHRSGLIFLWLLLCWPVGLIGLTLKFTYNPRVSREVKAFVFSSVFVIGMISTLNFIRFGFDTPGLAPCPFLICVLHRRTSL